MNKLLENKQKELQKSCKQYHVLQLFAFGSVVTEKFNQHSDVDLVVYFEKIPLLDYADNFFGLLHALESIFGRKVDLVSGKAMKNPFFIEEVEQTKQLVYGKVCLI